MIATPTQESEVCPAKLAALTSPHGRANGWELAPLSGAEGSGAATLSTLAWRAVAASVHPERSEGLQSEGLAIAFGSLSGRLGQNLHFLLQATAQMIFLDLKIMVRLEV